MARTVSEIFVIAGSNVGDRMEMLKRAERLLSLLVGAVSDRSSVYETAAWGKEDQDAYLNQVFRIRTRLSAQTVLELALGIERRLGRTREPGLRWEPRRIDLDILFYEDLILEEPGLSIPHPSLAKRRFVLVPLAELAADRRHPADGRTVREMLEDCPDSLEVSIFAGPD